MTQIWPGTNGRLPAHSSIGEQMLKITVLFGILFGTATLAYGVWWPSETLSLLGIAVGSTAVNMAIELRRSRED